ncbi:MAG TPA: methylmalonyl-CoA epimerase [Dehalococcoidia bacterium]|nr:methylmalonyl-CoA epimerase [Dehalococcoidia bacterium]
MSIGRIHHIALVLHDLDAGIRFYQDKLGLHLDKVETVEEQGVKAALLSMDNVEIELLEPLSEESGVGRYLARRGEGLHHVCFTTPDIRSEMAELKARGVELLDTEPRYGLAGLICFMHPRAHAGVLVELVEMAD